MYQSWAGFGTVGGGPNPNIAIDCGGEFLLSPSAIDPIEAAAVLESGVVGGISGTVNDGLVTVQSARYGTFRGCIPADHYGEAGGTLTGTLPDPDPPSGFDYVGFYVDIVRDLAARGF